MLVECVTKMRRIAVSVEKAKCINGVMFSVSIPLHKMSFLDTLWLIKQEAFLSLVKKKKVEIFTVNVIFDQTKQSKWIQIG